MTTRSTSRTTGRLTSHPIRGLRRLLMPLLVILACLAAASPAQALTVPTAPNLISVTPGKSQVVVTWSAGPVTAETAAVTGYLVSVTFAGGAPGPTCNVPATATSCTVTGLGGTVYITVQATSEAGSSALSKGETVVVTDKWPPPTPLNVQARVGSRPGEAIVTWRSGTPETDQSSADAYIVTATPANGSGATAQPRCGDADASTARCTVTGLAPSTRYRFSVVAVSLSGESEPATTTPLLIPGWAIRPPVRAILCSGSELEKPNTRPVRPAEVIVDCDAYGPQYGAPLVRTVDGISWSSWAKTQATGTGTLHWPTAIPCTQGQPAHNCGVTVTDYPVTIQLRNPQPLNAARSRFTFTEVGLFPTDAGPQECQSSCWVVPPRIAYE